MGRGRGRAKRKKVKNGGLHLPEPIIQHIQSFMTGKQAAQTSILSKSWHNAWSTRPNLDFDCFDMGIIIYKYLPEPIIQPWHTTWSTRPRIDFNWFDIRSLKFIKPEVAMEKTMGRYEKMNLNIQTFRLRIDCYGGCNNHIPFACELIVKAMRMGAFVVDLELVRQNDNFVLPQEVLGSETLIELSVANCKINLGTEEQKERLRLKSLILRSVNTEGDIICGIVSSCPLIENLELSECRCLFNSDDDAAASRRNRMLVLKPGINPYRFHKLKSLLLEKVVIGTWIFDDFSSTFPCLKDLAIHNCFGYKEIEICSRSLESISFAQASTLRATFDVPNIRKFTFSGSYVPSLSFKTKSHSRQWESNISIARTRNRRCLSSSWFSKLNEFLNELSPSRISLSLTMTILIISSEKKISGNVKKGLLSKRASVENLAYLSMDAPSTGVCSDLLVGLFSSCRPKLITIYWVPKSKPDGYDKPNNEFVKILCKMLIKEVSEDCFVANRITCGGLCDLEEVTVECLEEIGDEDDDGNVERQWRPLCWKTLLDASPSSGDDVKQIRFHLRYDGK